MSKKPAPKKEVDLDTAMRQAGFSKDAAKNINDFWARMGVAGVKVGRTTLKVKGGKRA